MECPSKTEERFVVERQIRGSAVGCMLHVNACCRQRSTMDFRELTPHTVQEYAMTEVEKDKLKRFDEEESMTEVVLYSLKGVPPNVYSTLRKIGVILNVRELDIFNCSRIEAVTAVVPPSRPLRLRLYEIDVHSG
ncbi:hypothetical protein EVAR_38879_1 [Eumeta japonica]|uniref:Uncharacterized protein n=1 Tax=Eumeta variegata TaxID=151549 RepID=A0A4C1X6H8_EUMVA|nr:hypothetical protein EVAR_38879_1 [Eumeta japonica]